MNVTKVGRHIIGLISRWGPASFLGILVCGCEPDARYLQLQRQIQDQQEQISSLEKQIADQRETIGVLRAQLAEDVGINQEEMDQLFGLREVIIEEMSGGYDTDDQVGDEGVVLYVQPVDRYGDVVKAPGRIEVTLHDLSSPSGRTLYHSCAYEMPQLWTYHYTLKCLWPPEGPPANRSLTARVVFTHHLTGQRLEAQRVVDVQLPLDTNPEPAPSP